MVVELRMPRRECRVVNIDVQTSTCDCQRANVDVQTPVAVNRSFDTRNSNLKLEI
jgi:hypothetical protein